MNNNPFTYVSALTLIATLALSACATESATEKNFGSSVRHMISQQSYQPGKDTAGLDGDKSQQVLDAYRKDVSRPDKVESPIININMQ